MVTVVVVMTVVIFMISRKVFGGNCGDIDGECLVSVVVVVTVMTLMTSKGECGAGNSG